MSQDDPKDGVDLIAAERARQINVKGWTAEHDDGHDRGELAKAGAFYAAGPDVCPITGSALMDLWPKEWGNPTTFEVGGFTRAGRIRELVIAGALVAAEIDRLLRQKARATMPVGGGAMTEVSKASLPGTPEERQALHDKARAIVLAVVETELGFTLDCNDSDPLTVADFLADVISGLERAQEREGGK